MNKLSLNISNIISTILPEISPLHTPKEYFNEDEIFSESEK